MVARLSKRARPYTPREGRPILSSPAVRWKLQEEAHHLARCIGPARVGIGAGRSSARPRMAGAMDAPIFEDDLAGAVPVQRAAISPTGGCKALLSADLDLDRRPRAGCRQHFVAIARTDRRVAIAVEYNSWND